MTFKVDVEKELDAKRESTTTETEGFVENVKALMAADGARERQNLKDIGLDFNITLVEKAQGTTLERKAFEDELGCKTFTLAEIRGFCLKYDLRLLKASEFVGTIDPSVGLELTKFLERNGLSARTLSSKFFVMAPPSAFRLQDMPAPPKPVNVDPCLFLQVTPKDVTQNGVEPYYVLVRKWGNDFTVARLIGGWMNRNPQNSFVFHTVAIGLVMSAIAGLVISPTWVPLAVLVAFGVSAIASLAAAGTDPDGEAKGFAESAERFNEHK